MKRKQASLFFSAIAAVAAASVHASDAGFYGYLAAGQSQSDRKAESDRGLAGAGATAFTSTMDDTDAAWKIQAGYRFNKNLAIEGGYTNFGAVTYRATITAPAVSSGVVKLDMGGWNLDLVGRLPFSDALSGYARLGAFVYDLDYQCIIISGPYSCGVANRSATGTSLHYGLGLEYAFAGNWFARVEYEVITDAGDALSATGASGTSKEDIRLGSVGIGYRF
jgi:OOP family OmpA-OmpF porin